MGFLSGPTLRTYSDVDGNQQSSLQFTFDFSTEISRNTSIFGTTHPGVVCTVDPKQAAGASKTNPFRSMSFKMLFIRQGIGGFETGELYIHSDDTAYCVSIQPQWTNNDDEQIYTLSGVMPVEMIANGKLLFTKLTDFNPQTQATPMSGVLIATLHTKALPAFITGGINVDAAPGQ